MAHPIFFPIADACVGIAAVPAVLASGYLAALAVFSRSPRRKKPTTPTTGALPVFDVVIPAHDEEENIAKTVASVLAVDYPRSAFRVVVVADNCTDDTARAARDAGADVLTRVDPKKRGKGYALEAAFAETLARGRADAIVVVDADTSVSKNILRAFAAALKRGELVVQADYGVRNPDASWRTRLMVIALAAFHGVRSMARERLGLSCGLRGNGMGFACSTLRSVPWDAFSVVEDVEYGIRLGEAGVRVAYVGEARVAGEMVSRGDDAKTQRQRWESGRRELTKKHALRLIRRGVFERNAMLLDLGVDLLVPPLTTIAVWTSLGLASSLFFRVASASSLAWIPWTFSALAVLGYVLRAVQVSGVGARGVVDVMRAPLFIAWKLAVPKTAARSWVRTTRERIK